MKAKLPTLTIIIFELIFSTTFEILFCICVCMYDMGVWCVQLCLCMFICVRVDVHVYMDVREQSQSVAALGLSEGFKCDYPASKEETEFSL